MRVFWQKRWQQWLNKRIPRQQQVTLNQRRIFIFPSKQGFYFLIVLLLLLIAAINYQNNLIYLLVFFLASTMNSAILFTYLNVSGLSLKAGKHSQAYAGDWIDFTILVSANDNRMHHQIQLSWQQDMQQTLSLHAEREQLVTLGYKTQKRGICRPPRLLVESYYPLGFIRCWSWVDLDLTAVVYPKPIEQKQNRVQNTTSNDGIVLVRTGSDDLYDFRAYQQGDTLRHIDWRSLAKGLPLQTKVFADKQQQSAWVDWDALSHYATEQRLAIMAGWLLALEKQQIAWGLRLPNKEIPQDLGENHKHQALTALALYGVSGENT